YSSSPPASWQRRAQSATKVVGWQMGNAVLFGVSLHRLPQYVRCPSSSCQVPFFETRLNPLPSLTPVSWIQTSMRFFTPRRHGDRSQSSALPNHIDDYPVAFP